MSEAKKDIDLNELEEVNGGSIPNPAVFKCKNCKKNISAIVYGRNNGFCEKCKPVKV